MPHCHPIRRTLRQHGCRATPQRVVILEALRSSGRHMTAEEIHAAVRDRFPAMDLSTVYRTLRLFTRLGLLERHVLGEGRIVYEWRDRPSHGHLRCRSCHQIFHLEESVLEDLRQELQSRLGLPVEQITLSALGLCSRCRARGSFPSEANP
ncbi:Fur family transcriptional regulator [Thermoflexus sp.]|uniref:Fur family transcriptional regulator n=1 Tax=Thermoflexus sp. TaxID=1969742 RepID=UPI0017639311|nr:Fur family transcriptional regulator [Thermoflexus sp.]